MFTPTFASSRVIGWTRPHPRAGRRQPPDPPERAVRRPAATATGPAGRVNVRRLVAVGCCVVALGRRRCCVQRLEGRLGRDDEPRRGRPADRQAPARGPAAAQGGRSRCVRRSRVVTPGHRSRHRPRARHDDHHRRDHDHDAPPQGEVTVSVPTLDTARLRLRPWHDDDLEPYAAMCADPEVMRYMGDGATLSRGDAWRSMAMFVGHWQLRGYGMWAVEERATRPFVGRVGLHRPEGWPGLEVGWMLDRATWGRGYATEAGRVVTRLRMARARRRPRDQPDHAGEPGVDPCRRAARTRRAKARSTSSVSRCSCTASTDRDRPRHPSRSKRPGSVGPIGPTEHATPQASSTGQ